MSKKVSTKMTPKEESTLEVTGKYYKFCPWCHTHYYSNARGQKYCCEAHQKLASAKQKEQKERYISIAPVERLRVRAHSLAVETLRVLVELGEVTHECSVCQKGQKETKLEVHHKDLNWLNGCPSNLAYLCIKHHAKAHSDLLKLLAEKGLTYETYLPSDFLPLANVINKDKQSK